MSVTYAERWMIIMPVMTKERTVRKGRRRMFEMEPDPFYSESNMAHLRRGIVALNAGKGTEHELLDISDE